MMGSSAMWATTPTYAVIFAFLSWMVLCWARIWFAPTRRPAAGPVRALLSTLVGRVFLIGYAFIGMHLLDIAARITFTDLIGYGRFSSVAAPVCLCAALGAFYIVRCAFIAPTWAILSAFAGMAGVYVCLSVMEPLPRLEPALWAGAALTVVLGTVEMLGFPGRQRGAGNDAGVRPIWDLSGMLSRVTGPWVYATVLVLLSVELVLQFEGMSLLVWL